METTPQSSFSIRSVLDGPELTAAAKLFRAYAASLGVDLGYQDFETELATLPGRYAPPTGALLLALGPQGEALGCAALRPLELAGICEMKRLYVAPHARGLGLGRALAQAILHAAQAAGYQEIRLDTLPFMKDAMALYARLGFRPIAPYCPSPVAGTVFLACPLDPPR